MPKGTPNKEEKPPKPATTKERVEGLTEAVEALAEGLKKLEDRLNDVAPQLTPAKVATAPLKAQEPDDSVPVPFSWRQILDTVLNAKFGATVRYLPNAEFELTIVVPPEYSNATPMQIQMSGQDRRVKIMGNYLGEAGVQEYATLVLENLGQEIRAKITDDRARLVSGAQPTL